MKKYIEPTIKVVRLDPEQAVLQVCQLNGNYFESTTLCVGTRNTGGPARCTLTVRSVPTSPAYTGYIKHDMPS